MKYTLDAWQADIVEQDVSAFAFGERSHSMLWCDVGTGKTPIAVAIAEGVGDIIAERMGKHPVTWVITTDTVKFQWIGEITKTHTGMEAFSADPRDVFVVDGTAEARIAQLTLCKVVRPRFVVTNYDTLKLNLPEVMDALDPHTDIVVLDEIHNIQNPYSDRAKACRALSVARYRIGAGATFQWNRIDDLYTPLQFLSPSHPEPQTFDVRNRKYEYPIPRSSHFWGTLSDFLREYAVTDRFGKIVGEKNVPQLKRELDRFGAHRIDADEVLDLPSSTEKVQVIDLYPEQRQVYHMAVDGFIRWLDDEGEDQWYRSRGNDAARSAFVNGLLAKLTAVRLAAALPPKQYVANMLRKQMQKDGLPVDWSRLDGELTDASAKLDYVRGYVSAQYPNKQTPGGLAVYSQWTQALDSYQAGLASFGKTLGFGRIDGQTPDAERERVRLGVLNGQVKLVLMSDAGSVGLNLQKLNAVVYNDLPWTASQVTQAGGRIKRRGQQNPMHFVHLVARDTIEEKRMLPNYKAKKREAEMSQFGERGRRYANTLGISDIDEVRGWL